MTLEIKGFIPTTLIDWEGKIACLVFLAGCNFRCPYCYSGDLITNPRKLSTIPFDEISKFLGKKRDWIDGIVLCGGEPTLYPELPELIKRFKVLPTAVKLDTNGSNPEMLKSLIDEGLVDYVAMDLKSPFSKYSEVTGVKVDQETIKESVQILMKGEVDYEFRTTVCPAFLNKDDVLQIAKSIVGCKRYILQQFRPGECLDAKLNEARPYSTEDLKEMAQFARGHVLNTYVRGQG